MQQKFDELIDKYILDGVGSVSGLIPPHVISGLRDRLFQLHFEGQLVQAGIGSNDSKSYDLQIRRDKIYWLDPVTENKAEKEFFSILDSFIDYLNRTCYTAINDYEFHYAVYEPGSFYKRHVDQFRYNNARKFSLITYLNENWIEEDNGSLVVYGESTERILPVEGRTVFFKSSELEHEVETSMKMRMSLTGWLKTI